MLIWSSAATVISFAEGMGAFLYTAIQYMTGFLLFLGLWCAKRQNPLPELRRIPWWFYLVTFMGIGIHDWTWVAAVQNAPSEQATLIIYQWPILIVLFSAFTLKKRLHVSQVIGCALGVAGVFVLMSGNGLSFDGFTLMPGHFYALVSALSWSLYSAIAAKYPETGDAILGVNFLVVSLICFGVWLGPQQAAMPPLFSLILVCGASVFVCAAYALWNFAMRRGDTQFVAVFSFLIPALASAWLVVFGFASFSQGLVISLVLIMAGIASAKYGGYLAGVIRNRPLPWDNRLGASE